MTKNIYPFIRFSRIISSFPQKICIAYEYRLFLCISGFGKIRIRETDLEVRKGSVVFIPSGLPYYYYPDNGDPFSFIGFNFDFNNPSHENPLPIPLAEPTDFNPAQLREPDYCIPPFDKPFILDDVPFLHHFFYEINREFSQKKLYYEHFCAAKMLELLYNIIRIQSSVSTEYSTEKTNDVLLYIQNHCSENLSNTEIGNRFGYHANYINRLIRQNTGMSLHKYLIQCRLDKVLQMLHDTDMSIGQIAEEAGFPDMPSFSKTFRQHLGVSASDYKKGFKK
ncbi:MAG: AraC family transcriptional regulator [Acutalibacteraceae bacterium]